MKESSNNNTSKAVLVALGAPQESETIREHLDELAFLAETAGIATVKRYIQNLTHPDSRTFVGKGKLEEIKAFVLAEKISNVVFDDDLSASQLRNLERELNPKSSSDDDFKVRVYDRSLLILDIFLWRAQTAQAKTQVELARYQYL